MFNFEILYTNIKKIFTGILSLVKTNAVASSSPFAIAISPDGGTIYTANYGSASYTQLTRN